MRKVRNWGITVVYIVYASCIVLLTLAVVVAFYFAFIVWFDLWRFCSIVELVTRVFRPLREWLAEQNKTPKNEHNRENTAAGHAEDRQ